MLLLSWMVMVDGGRKEIKGRNFGHLKGVETVKKIVKTSIKIGIPIVTFYVFSTENWKRPKSEINFLFRLIVNYFGKEQKSVHSNGIKINIIGRSNKLPPKIKKVLRDISNLTKKNKKILVNLAINYGSKNEIVDAINSLKKRPKYH